MSNARKALIGLFLLIVISASVHSVLAQENKTNTTQNATFSEVTQKSEVTQEDIIMEAQRNLDRSLSILNIVATSMGVLVGLITIIVVIAIAVGFFEYSKWKAIRKDIEKEANVIKEIRDKAENDAKTIRNEIKSISPTLFTEKPSSEIIGKVDELNHRLELLEILGLPLNPEDYFNRAGNLFFKGKYELALKTVEKAIELKPDDVRFWDGKGILLIKLGRYDDALKHLEEAIKFKPDSQGLLYNLACAYSMKGDKGKALSALKRAVELDISNKEMAKKDKDFEKLWNDEDFKKLVE
jgi:tetratricopeptide (TPR) repeat protein